ncbi:hypothetical protein SY2F82_25700 [Streptomyces sp. Y2F8-2]|uniref:hypothetical protein n=1 Tax=unclassified Streptomyces TaxID=2593676 RepID=UPI001906701F|nr:hypothetical protein [Streptomyces sp. Y2F8-2]GHK00773.1 hypothetical protein SY2F82_25700 [Streptomyces sp. Y2F8-2]
MGDRHSDGGAFARRRAGADRPVTHADSAAGLTDLEAALGHALRADALDTTAERRAMAAFRAARDAGVHKEARTRRRDDWSARRSPAGRSVKATVALFVATFAVGGVAIAAIGSPDSAVSPRDVPGQRRPSPTAAQPSRTAPEAAEPTLSATPSPQDRPLTAKDIQAHCRAYASVKGRGKALDSTAWQRFLAAAGGEDDVAAYCADQLSQERTGDAGKPSGTPNGRSADKKPGQAGRSG